MPPVTLREDSTTDSGLREDVDMLSDAHTVHATPEDQLTGGTMCEGRGISTDNITKEVTGGTVSNIDEYGEKFTKPDVACSHGDPVRRYLNERVTPYLLEGVKYIALHAPDKPLLWLSKYLEQKSHELEGITE